MINRFMISVAAVALIAGTGLANAQGTGTSREAPSMSRESPSGGSGMQQTAPSSDRGAATATPANRDAAEPDGKKSAQSEPKSSDPKAAAGAKNQRAEDNKMQDQKSKGMASENDKAGNAKDMKAEGQGREDRNNAMKAGDRDNNMKAEGRDGDKNKMNAETKTGADNKTVGQAGAGGKLSSEQRTKISSVIKEQHVQSVTNVNFSISVGTRVPRDVEFRPLPTEVVTIYPEWRGYEFILVHDQIVVIDPATYEIVAVIDA